MFCFVRILQLLCTFYLQLLSAEIKLYLAQSVAVRGPPCSHEVVLARRHKPVALRTESTTGWVKREPAHRYTDDVRDGGLIITALIIYIYIY